MVLLNRALVSCYSVSIVTMPLTELGVQSLLPFGGTGDRRLVPPCSGRVTLLASSDSFSVRRTV